MRLTRNSRAILFGYSLLAVLWFLGGCESPPRDYSALLNHDPQSILVLPPVNHSADIRASNAFLSTISTTLGEMGYYVFPIAVVDQMLKENGVPTPGDMHTVSYTRLREVFGADAALYVQIREWTTTYAVIDSTTKVRIGYRLVDLRNGEQFWATEIVQAYSSSSNQSSIAGMIGAALGHALSSAISMPERDLAIQANAQALLSKSTGILLGSRHPSYEENHTAAKLETQEAMARAAESGQTD